jgi:hypothetical protein
MTAVLDVVFQYRRLVGKCASGRGLEIDEIDELTAIEARFVPGDDDLRAREGRRFCRERVDFQALLKGGPLNDEVRVTEMSPGGLVCRSAPYAEEGQTLEVVIDDTQRALSYRFKATVQWLKDDVGDDFQLGLELVGTPVLVHYGAAARDEALEKIAA